MTVLQCTYNLQITRKVFTVIITVWLTPYLELAPKLAAEVKSKSYFDWRSVSKFWYRSPSGAHDQIFFTLWQLRSCFSGAPSLTRGWVYLVYMLLALGTRRPYFTVSDLRLLFPSTPMPRKVTVEVFEPASTRRILQESRYIASARTAQRTPFYCWNVFTESLHSNGRDANRMGNNVYRCLPFNVFSNALAIHVTICIYVRSHVWCISNIPYSLWLDHSKYLARSISDGTHHVFFSDLLLSFAVYHEYEDTYCPSWLACTGEGHWHCEYQSRVQ
jgi:hypothetical protein